MRFLSDNSKPHNSTTNAQKDAKKSLVSPSNTTYRLLLFLLFLTQHTCISQQQLNQNFMGHQQIGKGFSAETWRKYVYTLERLGFVIAVEGRAESFRYQLKTSPFAWTIPQPEKVAIEHVLSILAHQPNRPLFQQFLNLLQTISAYCRTENQGRLENLLDDEALRILLHASQQAVERLNQLERFCFEGQVLAVTVASKSQEQPETFEFSPECLRFEGQHGFLVGCHVETRQKVSLELSEILNISQLPRRAHLQALQVTVVFRLTGRVAQNYIAHPGETVVHEKNCLLVKHRTDELDALLRRLTKYGPACKIEAPQSIQTRFQNNLRVLAQALKSQDEHKSHDWVESFLAAHV